MKAPSTGLQFDRVIKATLWGALAYVAALVLSSIPTALMERSAQSKVLVQGVPVGGAEDYRPPEKILKEIVSEVELEDRWKTSEDEAAARVSEMLIFKDEDRNTIVIASSKMHRTLCYDVLTAWVKFSHSWEAEAKGSYEQNALQLYEQLEAKRTELETHQSYLKYYLNDPGETLVRNIGISKISASLAELKKNISAQGYPESKEIVLLSEISPPKIDNAPFAKRSVLSHLLGFISMVVVVLLKLRKINTEPSSKEVERAEGKRFDF